MKQCKDRKHSEARAWRWFSRMIRLEASDAFGLCKCYTCSTVKFWKDMDAGHYFPQGVNKQLKFDERNVHPQETSCNKHKGGNLSEYATHLIQHYGPKIFDELKAKRAMNIKISQSGFDLMAEEYKERALKAAKDRGLEIKVKKDE